MSDVRQGRRGEFEPDKAHSTVVGMPPLVEIWLTVTQNLGKARALEALVDVAPLKGIHIISMELFYLNFLK